ncbi:MAG: hypothetical protein JSV63_02915 [Candidatus Aenigmatarchaeota archaeon]|nr:MAG: hypothetical protein JSV63_02915 [Candidatus Aenigmarchaeota archaeon]
MKGLSLTLSIVIIAIVLLVTALVIMTIFGSQIAQILSILNPWSQQALESNLCQQKCATWCQLNPGLTSPPNGWNEFTIDRTLPDNSKKPVPCGEIMTTAAGAGTTCRCLGA